MQLQQRAESKAVAQTYMTGRGISINGRLLSKSHIVIDERRIELAEFAHLFWLFDGASGSTENTDSTGGDGAPPGIYVRSDGPLVHPEHYIRVGIYKQMALPSLLINSLFIDHVFLDENRSPPLMGTVGFILCALAAYKQGLRSIRLLAAGGVDPRDPEHPYGEDYHGYFIWPKLGFNARLHWHERFDKKLWRCRTVQDVRSIDESIWVARGYQRFMTFDLRPSSISWNVLLDYARTRV